jgi:hypothetical protein
MRKFDRLPPEVRRALADADHPWAPSWCETAMLWHNWTPRQVIERLARADRDRQQENELELAGLIRIRR